MSDATPATSARTGGPLALVYFLAYATLGITLPFLPQHLHALGLTGAQAGKLLALSPLMTFFAPPLWGWLADRTRRGAVFLCAALLGTTLAFIPLLFATTALAILPWLFLWAFFYAPVGMLVDSLNLERVHQRGGHFGQTRLWGSIGFIASSSAFSLVYDGTPGFPPPVIVAAASMAGIAFAASLTLVRNRSAQRAPSGLRDAVALLRDGRIRLLMAVAFLHWIANAPFNTRFTVYVKGLGHPSWVAGFGMAVGVIAEVVVMACYPAIARRFTPARVLAASTGVSALRWILVGTLTGAAPLIALQLLHGLTFGAFLVASISYLATVVPPRLRATGQALFASTAFGLSGVIGYLTAGHLFDLRPAGEIFIAAGFLELLPAALALLLPVVAPAPGGDEGAVAALGSEP